MLKTFDVKLDVEKALYEPMQILFHVSSNDIDSVELSFEITQDNAPFDLTGRSVQLAIKKPSGKVVYQSIEITDSVNGKASARLSQDAYVESGIHTSEVYIKDVVETIVISPFYFNSWESITATETVEEGTGEVYWNNILNKPLTFPSDPHTHAIADVVGLQSALDSKADEGTVGDGGGTLEPHTHAIADVTDLQTALDGKVDDAEMDGKADAIHTHAIADVTGLQNALEGKVDDAEMTNKADLNHIHQIVDVEGLQTALDGKADDGDLTTKANVGDSYLKTETYAKTEVYNKTEVDQMTFDGGGSNIIVEDNLTSTSTTNALSSNQGRILNTTKAEIDHVHDILDVTGLQDELDGKASVVHTHTEYAPTVHTHTEYAPTVHTHAIADVTDLQTTLDAKADDIDLDAKSDVGHTHTKADITDFAHTHTKADITDFAHTHTRADITDFAHTHAIEDVTNLGIELDGKADVGHTHTKADITDFAHSHTSADITDFGTAVGNNIPLEYLTQTEGDARYQPSGTVPTHTHDEYLTQTEGDALYQPIGAGVPSHTHTEADLTFGTKNAKTYVDDADNYVLFTVLDGLKLQKVTQLEYDNITTKDPNTLYFIVG